jgi:diadenosine tetraphosphate (Ap4A) HIT family hydrolase
MEQERVQIMWDENSNQFELPLISKKEKERLKPFPPPEGFEHLHIRSYRLWTVFLAPDQYYLGRCYLWLNRHEDMHNFTNLTEEELHHLCCVIGVRIKRALTKLWKPDLVNVCWLGNDFAVHRGHGHVHFIPRYARPKIFYGYTFHDARWGKNYAPFRKREYDSRLLSAIRDELKSYLD